MQRLKHILPALVFLLPFQTMAWGKLGHRVTGGIAEKYLSAKAKKAVQDILGTESMAIASNWADFIKADPAYNYLSSWHYADLPGGLTAAQFTGYLKKDTSVDAYTKLNFITAQLRLPGLAKDKKLLYLRLLIHLIGDIHQPMHVAHPEDKGGNDIRVFWFGAASNLHRVWDENLIEFQGLSYTEYIAAINHPTATQVKRWQGQSLADWMFETYQDAGQLYQEIHPDDKLSYAYDFKHVAMMNELLLKAGVRLAAVLNKIFG